LATASPCRPFRAVEQADGAVVLEEKRVGDVAHGRSPVVVVAGAELSGDGEAS